MKDQVIDVMKVCQVFYILCHIFGILVLLIFKNSIFSSYYSSLIFWLIKISSGILFFIAGRNPGYTSKSEFEAQCELQENDWDPPLKLKCEICDITQPYRTKHCYECEECISKFDHHCFWLGSCVGELNHFKFVLYLILESISLVWIFFYCFEGNSIKQYLFYAILGLMCIGFGALTIGLGVFHVYIISIGTTTWEVFRRKSISYLKPYPYNYHPFSKSFLKNWADCIKATNIKQWVLPRPLAVYPFNWFENEYWSCC